MMHAEAEQILTDLVSSIDEDAVVLNTKGDVVNYVMEHIEDDEAAPYCIDELVDMLPIHGGTL